MIETFFDSRLDLIERRLKVHSDRLKSKAGEVISKNLSCVSSWLGLLPLLILSSSSLTASHPLPPWHTAGPSAASRPRAPASLPSTTTRTTPTARSRASRRAGRRPTSPHSARSTPALRPTAAAAAAAGPRRSARSGCWPTASCASSRPRCGRSRKAASSEPPHAMLTPPRLPPSPQPDRCRPGSSSLRRAGRARARSGPATRSRFFSAS